MVLTEHPIQIHRPQYTNLDDGLRRIAQEFDRLGPDAVADIQQSFREAHQSTSHVHAVVVKYEGQRFVSASLDRANLEVRLINAYYSPKYRQNDISLGVLC